MVKDSKTEEDSQRVFLNDEECTSIFQIPAHLVKSYGPVLPSKATLRVDDSGKKWRVLIEKFKDCYFFTDGWKEFAEQVDLEALDFLMFKSSSSSRKKGTNEEKTRETNGDEIGPKSYILNENQNKGSHVGTKLGFIKEMKKSHRYRVVFPEDFILSTRIQKDRKIRLKDGEGREWPVIVSQMVTDGRFCMCKGWCDFVKGNTVMLGSTISFTWLSEDMLLTRIVDVGTDKQPLFSTSRNRRNICLQDPHS